jgi:hypothetical protein
VTEVFVAERGQLTPQSKRDLREAGIIVAEVKLIARCQFVRAGEVMDASDLTWAALDALNLHGDYGSHGTKQRDRFVSNLLTVLNAVKEETVA